MTIKRINRGKGHSYLDTETGQPVPGVTTLIDGGMPKKALINWAGDATAEYAVDNWDELGGLSLSERLKRMKGGSTRSATPRRTRAPRSTSSPSG